MRTPQGTPPPPLFSKNPQESNTWPLSSVVGASGLIENWSSQQRSIAVVGCYPTLKFQSKSRSVSTVAAEAVMPREKDFRTKEGRGILTVNGVEYSGNFGPFVCRRSLSVGRCQIPDRCTDHSVSHRPGPTLKKCTRHTDDLHSRPSSLTLRVSMYVCVCVCVSMSLCVYVCPCPPSLSACVCVYGCVCVCVCVYVGMCLGYLCLWLWLCGCLCLCAYLPCRRQARADAFRESRAVRIPRRTSRLRSGVSGFKV